MNDFERAHQFTAQWEGGYVWNRNDPGGETNLGITRSVWLRWCQSRYLPAKPMRELTLQDVLPLYEAWYWRPLAAGLPWPLSAAIYDMSVNHGVGDGHPDDENGSETGATWMLWRARQRCPNGTPLEQALAACDAREEFYRAIIRRRPTSREFLPGWLNRVNAQREWLRANAEPTTPRVLLVPQGGGEPVPWDGKPARYGGVLLDGALIEQLQLVYPRGGGPWTYQTLKLWRRQNGDLVLERALGGPQ